MTETPEAKPLSDGMYAKNQRKFRQRQREKGMVTISLFVPAKFSSRIRRALKKLIPDTENDTGSALVLTETIHELSSKEARILVWNDVEGWHCRRLQGFSITSQR